MMKISTNGIKDSSMSVPPPAPRGALCANAGEMNIDEPRETLVGPAAAVQAIPAPPPATAREGLQIGSFRPVWTSRISDPARPNLTERSGADYSQPPLECNGAPCGASGGPLSTPGIPEPT
ncbi:hypothetical protein BLTE_13950 [Blastochloris tepida]|uniref:Uncharacterized protein n=1 Tax=Blastochloris tepida TaxID=2233851 RepID=A0A348FZH7_9HYPH|nr:hypothetical protein BLTE_13950 [Blastochloris tepida]